MVIFAWLHEFVPTAIAFSIGPFQVHWYGLCLALGVLAAYALTQLSWRKSQRSLPQFDSLVLLLVGMGIVGARLVDVFIFEWWYFRDHVGEVFAIWQGGLAFHGALLGGAVVLYFWARRHQESRFGLLDFFAPGLALGQSIGRWGNYFNQELFGLPTGLPWGIPIVPLHRPVDYAAFAYFHPTFLYESMVLLLLALGLYWWQRRGSQHQGQLFAVYLVVTGAVRFALEFIRVDAQVELAGIRVGFVVAGVVVALGIWLWWYSTRVHIQHTRRSGSA